MQVGSIVEVVANFEHLRRTWGIPYPKKGDVLTISGITKHPNKKARENNIVLLSFEETPFLIGICDKKFDSTPNFIELLLHDEIKKLLNLEKCTPSKSLNRPISST